MSEEMRQYREYPDGVPTVLLKSRVGPTTVTVVGPDVFDHSLTTKLIVDFSLDNDCRERVPRRWWESIRNEYHDRTANRLYKETFLEL